MTRLERQAENVLSEVGLRPGQSVLDFGCGSGTYAVPAAHIVGDDGEVYAVDKAWHGIWPGEGLAKLRQRAQTEGLANIHVMKTSGGARIDLDDAAVDVVLAHDVLHSYYSSMGQIAAILREMHRVLRPGGFLSLYPGDPEVSGDARQLQRIVSEIEAAGFRLEVEYALNVVHENTIVSGHVTRFAKVADPCD